MPATAPARTQSFRQSYMKITMPLTLLEHVMKKHLSSALAIALFASAAVAEDKAATSSAQKLHDSKCMTCHKTEVYSREDRRVQSLHALSNQVENCMKGPAGANWSATETQAVVDYLNSRFYKF